MRPVPIPDEVIPEGARRMVLFSPDEEDTLTGKIAPVEAMFYIDDEGNRMFGMLIQIEDQDIDSLEATGGKFMLTMMGAVVPFGVFPLEVLEVGDGEDEGGLDGGDAGLD